jgi:membrane dipeptidase
MQVEIIMRIFDLHCDTITVCEEEHKKLRKNNLHVDLERMKKADSFAQCFAIYIDQKKCESTHLTAYEKYKKSLKYFQTEMSENKDMIAQVFKSNELKKNFQSGKISAILTVEGGEVIGEDLNILDEIYSDGVKLITLTWNYENAIGYPHSSENGLKQFGFEVVEKMNDLGMLVDVSHLSDKGFYDVLSVSKKPIIATHSCARSICNHTRNMTDDMLHALGVNGGVVGLNFFRSFLIKDGKKSSLDMVLKHAKHIVNCAGIDALALGSDFDGIDGEIEWKDYSGMQTVVDTLGTYFNEEELEKICYKNAYRIFAQ